MQLNEHMGFYISRIEDDFLPYWFRFVDNEYGGILNCINNYGEVLLKEDKFTWSQGRWLWVLSSVYELAEQGILTKIDKNFIKEQMRMTFDFLAKHSIGEKSVCNFRLSRAGKAIIDEDTGRYDSSIYADCFALIGIANYIKTQGLSQFIPIAEKLFLSIVNRIKKGDYLTQPYPVPIGYKAHGIPMIMTNVVTEVVLMKHRFDLDCEQEKHLGKELLDEVFTDFYDGDGLIYEYVKKDEKNKTTVLQNHINPGHTLEAVWFYYEMAELLGCESEYIDTLNKIVKTTFALGWDEEHGGLLRFVGKDGEKPTGECENETYERLILSTWDMKLWWCHSEAMYVLLLFYRLTGDEEMLRLYEKVKKYSFDTFPNKECGEWVQIRQRDGTPEEKVVALPVKDPFHILRNFIKIIEL